MTPLRSLAFAVVFIAWTLVLGIVYLPLLAGPRRTALVATRFWLDGSLALLRGICGLSYEVRGEIPQGAVLFAAKHQSTLETFAFRQILSDPAVILKRELLMIPIFGWYLWKTGVIAIDRSARTASLRSIVEGTAQARDQGRPVLIFPEGTRRKVGADPAYHAGIYKIHKDLDLPVHPIAVNTGLFWGRGSVLKRPGIAVIEFLPPIPTGLDRKTFMAELENRTETATARLIDEARRSYPHLPR